MRAALRADEVFLFALRARPRWPGISRVGEPADDAAHRARLLYRYDAAQVTGIDGAPPVC